MMEGLTLGEPPGTFIADLSAWAAIYHAFNTPDILVPAIYPPAGGAQKDRGLYAKYVGKVGDKGVHAYHQVHLADNGCQLGYCGLSAIIMDPGDIIYSLKIRNPGAEYEQFKPGLQE